MADCCSSLWIPMDIFKESWGPVQPSLCYSKPDIFLGVWPSPAMYVLTKPLAEMYLANMYSGDKVVPCIANISHIF